MKAHVRLQEIDIHGENRGYYGIIVSLDASLVPLPKDLVMAGEKDELFQVRSRMWDYNKVLQGSNECFVTLYAIKGE